MTAEDRKELEALRVFADNVRRAFESDHGEAVKLLLAQLSLGALDVARRSK